MDECLQVLEESQECATDEILVQQVRLQLIVENVTLDAWNDKPIKTPLSFYLQALHSQFQTVKNKLPAQSQCTGELSTANYFVICSDNWQMWSLHTSGAQS